MFAPDTWAQWSIGATDRDRRYVESGVQIFRLDQSTPTPRIEDITTDAIQEVSFGRVIRGCHRLPNNSLLIAVDLESSSEGGTAFIKVDGNGHVQCDGLRIPYPVEPLGWLRGYGLILADGWEKAPPWRLSSLKLQPEAIPEALSDRVPTVRSIGQLGLRDGRLLVISETGALILDTDPQRTVRIGRPAWGDTIRSSSISGVLRDGSVVISESAELVGVSPRETDCYFRLDYLARIREPGPVHFTQTGCVIRETDTSIEVSRMGLDGPFDDLFAKDDIRSALGLDGELTFELTDIEDDGEGSWRCS